MSNGLATSNTTTTTTTATATIADSMSSSRLHDARPAGPYLPVCSRLSRRMRRTRREQSSLPLCRLLGERPNTNSKVKSVSSRGDGVRAHVYRTVPDRRPYHAPSPDQADRTVTSAAPNSPRKHGMRKLWAGRCGMRPIAPSTTTPFCSSAHLGTLGSGIFYGFLY